MDINALREKYTSQPNKYRALKLCHGFPYAKNLTIPQKEEIIREKMKEYADIGYGGIVTNVKHDSTYLQNDEEWYLLRYSLQAAKDAGMRTWLYDEKGYPSGGAGGLTLEGHPEWQARAAAVISASAKPGERIRIDFPRGHNYVLSAYAYKAENLDRISDYDVMHPLRKYEIYGTQQGIDEINEGDDTITVVYVVEKYMYEGTHAIHNVCEARRYIDVSNREAVAAFIENTYRPYIEKTGDCGAEAIFTDEPSYMAAYINLGLKNGKIRDEYDETIPMLPSVNWGADVRNRFESEYGYSILDRAVCLFAGNGRLARKTRLDYYELMSKLYEESFFTQLSDFCARGGIAFSGHVLLEDSLCYHPVFEGNFFSLLRHMHYPGIDMLNGTPEATLNDAFTPKLVSSVAHTYGRKHVMSEISAHAQGGNVTFEQMLGCVAAQYVLGVDIFTSYFSERQLDTDTYRVFNDTIERIDCIMNGGKHIAHAAVYYPIETVQQAYIPQAKEIYQYYSSIPDSACCWNSTRKAYYSLLNNQIDFDFLDLYAIERSEISGGRINAMGGESFEVLVIPACRSSERLESAVRKLTDNGVKVIALRGENFKEDFDALVSCGAVEADSENIPSVVRGAVCTELTFADKLPSVIYLCRENENGRSILMVNTSSGAVSSCASVNGFGGCVKLYDPKSDTLIGEYGADRIPFTLDGYGMAMILS